MLSLKFSPTALHVDSYARKLGRNTFLGCIFHSASRLLSLMMKHKIVELRVTENPPPLIAGSLTDLITASHEVHNNLLSGYNITLHSDTEMPIVILILWAFDKCDGFHDVFTSLKRVIPHCRLTTEELMTIPLCYATYRRGVYIPPPELISIIHPQKKWQ